jgi:hypothetical protein
LLGILQSQVSHRLSVSETLTEATETVALPCKGILRLQFYLNCFNKPAMPRAESRRTQSEEKAAIDQIAGETIVCQLLGEAEHVREIGCEKSAPERFFGWAG